MENEEYYRKSDLIIAEMRTDIKYIIKAINIIEGKLSDQEKKCGITCNGAEKINNHISDTKDEKSKNFNWLNFAVSGILSLGALIMSIMAAKGVRIK